MDGEVNESSEVLSDVFSTASEMGTVINIGSTRMAEIDAMADLVEAGGSPGGYDNVTAGSHSNDHSDMESILALPSLGMEPVSYTHLTLPTKA